MSDDSPLLLYRAPDAIEAALIVQALEAAGIPTSSTGGSAAIGFGELPADARQVDVWVARGDAARGKRAIEAHQGLPRADPGRGEWDCPTCRESNAPSFEVCWSCKGPRPPAD